MNTVKKYFTLVRCQVETVWFYRISSQRSSKVVNPVSSRCLACKNSYLPDRQYFNGDGAYRSIHIFYNSKINGTSPNLTQLQTNKYPSVCVIE